MIDEERKKLLTKFLSENNLKCKNLELLERALTHSSYTHENNLSSFENYERLEFLGDAVLKITASRYLYDKFENYKEGDLTKIRSILVSDSTIAKFASEINLGRYMKFGISEKKHGGDKRKSNLACAFEAVLGALYLDGKEKELKNFLLKFIEKETLYIEEHKKSLNSKSVLQEYSQEKYKTLPVYETLKEKGPAHKKIFEVKVSINDKFISQGSGNTKKEAQQNAAFKALITLGIINKDCVNE